MGAGFELVVVLFILLVIICLRMWAVDTNHPYSETNESNPYLGEVCY